MDAHFDGDDLRKTDPKFQRAALRAVSRRGRSASISSPESVTASASSISRFAGCSTRASHVALWGARRPGQLQPVDEVVGWSLDAAAKAEIDRILRETITDPVGPEFMAPPPRPEVGGLKAAE